jgi:hypothetical protein
LARRSIGGAFASFVSVCAASFGATNRAAARERAFCAIRTH